MCDIFRELNELGLWDFEVHSFASDAGSAEGLLVVRGSRDFSYYHNAEIRFVGVEYLELPTRFSHARLRKATAQETAAFRDRLEFDGTLFCVTEECDSPEERLRYVVASSVELDLRTVRYDRESTGISTEGPTEIDSSVQPCVGRAARSSR